MLKGVKAIYSSGGKSWHAIFEMDEGLSKPEFDQIMRERVKKVFPKFGADPGALTPVRLTRLPGCTRNGRLQKLIYLNPSADGGPIVKKGIIREI